MYNVLCAVAVMSFTLPTCLSCICQKLSALQLNIVELNTQRYDSSVKHTQRSDNGIYETQNS